jgi:hypothetical protein
MCKVIQNYNIFCPQQSILRQVKYLSKSIFNASLEKTLTIFSYDQKVIKFELKYALMSICNISNKLTFGVIIKTMR